MSKTDEIKDVRFCLSAGSSENGEICNVFLNTKWTHTAEFDLKEQHGMDIKDVIAVVLVEELKKSITLELVKELLDGIVEANDE